MNSFTNQGEFVAKKALSGRKAPRCDKHQFRDEITWSFFEKSLFDKVAWTKDNNLNKSGTFTTAHVYLSSARLLGNYMSHAGS